MKQHALLLKLAEAKGQGSTVVTGLRFSAQEGMVDRLQTMLDKRADVNAKDTAGYTALGLAAFHEHEEVVQLLLDNGGKIALHIAALSGQNNTVQLLLAKGADLTSADDRGHTALHLVTFMGDQATASHGEMKTDIDYFDRLLSDLSLEQKTYIQREARHGLTAGRIATINGCKKVQRLLRPRHRT